MPFRILLDARSDQADPVFRQSSLARTLGTVLEGLGIATDIRLLALDHAPKLGTPIPTYRCPSRPIGEGVSWVDGFGALFQPNIWILDGPLQGYGREFARQKPPAHRFIRFDRSLDQRVRRGRDYQTGLMNSDLVLVEWQEDALDPQQFPPEGCPAWHVTGPLLRARPGERWSRDAVRAYFGVPADRRLVFVTLGAPETPATAILLEEVVTAAQGHADWWVVVGRESGWSGRSWFGPGIVTTHEPDLWRFFAGFDLAITSGEAWLMEELLAAQVPCAFFPTSRGTDVHETRIARYAALGKGTPLSPCTKGGVHNAMDQTLPGASEAALEPALGVYTACRHILHDAIDAGELDVAVAAVDAALEALQEWDALPAPAIGFAASYRVGTLWQRVLTPEGIAPTVPRLPIEKGRALAEVAAQMCLTETTWDFWIQTYARFDLSDPNALSHADRLLADLTELHRRCKPGLAQSLLDGIQRQCPVAAGPAAVACLLGSRTDLAILADRIYEGSAQLTAAQFLRQLA